MSIMYPFSPTNNENNPSNTKEPLSLKFIHKPRRSEALLVEAQDKTRENSLINSVIGGKSEDNDSQIFADQLSKINDLPSTEEKIPNYSLDPDDYENHRLIRKKSGEIVKPSLKESIFGSPLGKNRAQSLPTTPTYKQVHFGGDNETRYFNEKDKPNAISANNSPYASDDDGIYSDSESDDDPIQRSNYDDLRKDLDKHGSTKFLKNDKDVDWRLKLQNFPELSYDKKILEENSPVFLERMFISIDKKYLLGHIAVKNIAFEKLIIVRYTLDNWTTIIEIPTTYVPDIPQILKKNAYDRFIFKIPLYNLFNTFRILSSNENLTTPSNSDEKSFELCIKFISGDHEFWDNNYHTNYLFNLRKIVKVPKLNIGQLQSHTNKPRYSSSYLKRRLSDSNIIAKKDTNNLNLNNTNNQQNENTSHNLSHNTANEINTGNNKHHSSAQLINQSFGKPYEDADSYFDTSPATTSHYKFFNNFQNSDIKFKENYSYTSFEDSPKLKADGENKYKIRNFIKQDIHNDSNSPNSSPQIAFNKLCNRSHKDAKKAMNSKNYQDLLNTYCFFSKPDSDEDTHERLQVDIR